MLVLEWRQIIHVRIAVRASLTCGKAFEMAIFYRAFNIVFFTEVAKRNGFAKAAV